MSAIKLVGLRAPLDPVEFPNGSTFAVRDVDAATARLIDEAREEVSEEKYRMALQHICPDATAADFDTLTGEDVANLILHATKKLRDAMTVVEDRRKNEDGGTGGSSTTLPTPRPRSRRSSPTTRSRTSSPVSPAPTPAPAASTTSSVSLTT